MRSPAELIPPPKNLLVFEGREFFIYEEKLEVGDTRARHSHSQRVEIRLNQGPQLTQQIWRDGQVVQQHPPIVNWREPVIHEVKNVGDMALRNFILGVPARAPRGIEVACRAVTAFREPHPRQLRRSPGAQEPLMRSREE